ncbi:MAG: transcription-repair coupling factor [bacterium]
MKRSKKYEDLLEQVRRNNNFIVTKGLVGGASSYLAANLSFSTNRALLIVVGHNEKAEEFYDDLNFWGLQGVCLYPQWETLPFEEEEPPLEIAAKQFETLAALRHWRNEHTGPAPVVVTTVEALLQKVLAPEAFEKLLIHAERGKTYSLDALATDLVRAGFERVVMVESRGEFSIRGGILDVYSLDQDHPCRLDFFGDELEAIKPFDIQTQRSLKDAPTMPSVTFLPAKSQSVLAPALAEGAGLTSLLDWLRPDSIIIEREAERFGETAEKFAALIERQYREMSTGDNPPKWTPEKLYLSFDAMQRSFKPFVRVQMSGQPAVEHATDREEIVFHTASFESVAPQLESYLGLMKRKQSEDFLVNVVCDNDGQIQRLDEVLREKELGALLLYSNDSDTKAFRERDSLSGYPDIVLSTGSLHNGFSFNEIQLMIVTDREIFGRYKRRHIYRKIFKGAPIAGLSEIRRGDYVVHVEHGIGRFEGFRYQKLNDQEMELIELLYQDGDRLLVPVDKVHYLQKYTAAEGVEPSLDKLGSKRWISRRRKSQEAIEKMAEELLEIYARRAQTQGHRFATDTVWQREFEASFIYHETPDQWRAIEEVKEDMCSEKAMDRLVCGDVGYGKTEVAIRAAFKAVQEKRQVALLVPTTILGQQHYKTFSERFADYPVRVEVLSRFRTPKQQKETLKALKLGLVDIVVGTHRLLSKDVEFADLGLLIVDEEQRFGVRQKEKIKALKASVDVLTLTATPIPRTLYMALSGLRDMSVINTPPPDRQPIKTRVIHFLREQIEEAILRELNRGGQIYFVHNRIQNIHLVEKQLLEIAPQARIVTAHGQMNEHELERVMLDFIDGKFDVLLSTTIIENGLDIPNVNTIIINRADAFGLAQLYQLRGRVGRDVKRAYAYLIVPEGQPITEAAVKRLAAIEEFTDLGSGFQVAMRDMEIRGTGSLLGREQHGAIVDIGFELYCQLLEQAVRRLKGETIDDRQPVEIKWRTTALLPHHYVPIEGHRIALYKKFAAARELREIDDLNEELEDRYGELPEAVRNLVSLSKMRVLGTKCGLSLITLTDHGFKAAARGSLMEILKTVESVRDKTKDLLQVSVDAKQQIEFRVARWNARDRLSFATDLLEKLAGTLPEEEDAVAVQAN